MYVSDIPSFGISKDTFAISPVGADKTEMLGLYLPAPNIDGYTFGYGTWSHLSDFYCGIGSYSMKGFSTTGIVNVNYTFGNTDDCIDCRPLDSDGNLITDSEGIFNHYSEIRDQFSDTAWEMFQCVCGDLIEYYGAEGIGSLDSNCHSGCMITEEVGWCGYAYDPGTCYSAINDLCIDRCTGDSSDFVFNRNACDQFTNNYNRGGWVIENEIITRYDLTITNNDTGNTFSSTSFPYDRLAGDANNIFFRNFISDGHDITFTNLDEGNYKATITAITENESEETHSMDFEVRDIIPIIQSISNTVLPWQGIHLTSSGIQNTKDNWDNYDLDKRPSLGTFYYDDDNIRREDWLYDGFDDEFNRQLDECSSPEFTPDADVRMFRTTGISNSLLWKYWDNNIQPSSYQETVAPIEVQVYLYPRRDGNLLAVRDVDRINYKLGYYYAAYIDWDDGTPIEYNTGEPFELGYNNILKHSYEKAGIYEISGYMLRAEKSPEKNNVTGICYNQYFTIRININEGDDNEFEYLGGDDYSTIPYKETVPVIGGASKNSIYYKTLRRQLGYLDEDGISPSISTEFERIGDRLRVENALATLDDTRIGPLQSTFTGSYNGNGSVIYGGSFKTFGELGDSLGDADIGQIRYFDRSIQMYEMLGFPCDDYIESDEQNLLLESKVMFSGYDYTDPDGSGYGLWYNFTDRPTGTGGERIKWNNIGIEPGESITFSGEMKIDQVRLDAGGAVKAYAWSSSLINSWNRSVSLAIDETEWTYFSIKFTRDPEDETDNQNNSCGWSRTHDIFSGCLSGTPTGYYWAHPDNPVYQARSGNGPGTGNFTEGQYGLCYDSSDNALPPGSDFHNSDDYCMCGASGDCERSPGIFVDFGIYHYPNDISDGTSSIRKLHVNRGDIATDFEMPGFQPDECEETHAGNPEFEQYWQNIIPEDYNLLNREGITIDDNEIEIDENASQDWDGGYYYPVLPKLDRYGKFIEDMQKPLSIPAMDNSYMTGSLLINIEPEYIDIGVLNDSAGKGNAGMVIGDYKVSFDPKTREPKKERNASNIRIGRKDKAY